MTTNAAILYRDITTIETGLFDVLHRVGYRVEPFRRSPPPADLREAIPRRTPLDLHRRPSVPGHMEGMD